jgi:hypothetical protein
MQPPSQANLGQPAGRTRVGSTVFEQPACLLTRNRAPIANLTGLSILIA